MTLKWSFADKCMHREVKDGVSPGSHSLMKLNKVTLCLLVSALILQQYKNPFGSSFSATGFLGGIYWVLLVILLLK